MAKKQLRTATHKDKPVQSIGDIIKLEKMEQREMGLSDKIAESITAFSGSMLYVLLHVLWFGAWIVINLGMLHGIKPFDPFPFSLLTMVVSLEAIFLSSFVLVSQNKQAQIADRRAKIDLQINMLDERETSKLIEMVADLQKHFHIHKKVDKQIREMIKPTDLKKLTEKLDKEEEKNK